MRNKFEVFIENFWFADKILLHAKLLIGYTRFSILYIVLLFECYKWFLWKTNLISPNIHAYVIKIRPTEVFSIRVCHLYDYVHCHMYFLWLLCCRIIRYCIKKRAKEYVGSLWNYEINIKNVNWSLQLATNKYFHIFEIYLKNIRNQCSSKKQQISNI